MKDKYCKHCWPTKRKTHFFLYLKYYTNKLTILFKPFGWFFKKIDKLQPLFWAKFLEILSIFRIVSFTTNPDVTKLYNRSLIFFKEAKERGLKIEAVQFFGRYINEFRFIYKDKKYYYKEIPLVLFEPLKPKVDNKDFFKKILEKNNLPTPKGRSFTNLNKAVNYGMKIEFPLVVKPCNGSLSHHATYPIESEKELVKAIKIAKQYKPEFIVEKYFKGSLFRASVIGQKYLFICKKEKANVIGDGSSTIKELIELKNNNPKRGETNQKNSTLHKISIDKGLIKKLTEQNLELESIPDKGEKIILQNKVTLSKGCDIINVKGKTHPENKKLFLKIAKILESGLVGFDFICPDICKSYKKQKTAILEANSLPFIDMHQFPSKGEKEPVAKLTWDIVLKKIGN